MPMAGGWTMSMAWMPLPGQTRLAAAASFLGMWVVMMVAMMLPSLATILWRYREAVGRPASASVDWLTAWVGLGYFFAWAAFGLVAYPLGLALAALTMGSPGWAQVAPVAGGWAVLLAGMLQISRWKSRHLACCRPRSLHMGHQPAVTGAAWRYGLRLGLHCCGCCASLMVVLLVAGVMDLRAMAVVTACITLERLLPDGERAARAIGVVIVGAGSIMIARTVGLA